MEAFIIFLQELDWSPLWISLKTGAVATGITFCLGICAAWLVLRARPRIQAVLDGVFTLPMVLPPTVAGFLLLLIFSTRRPIGSFLQTSFDIKIVQTWAGCVLAACVISFPLMYRNARAAFEQVDFTLLDAARTLGLSEWCIFWRILMPLAAPGIRSGAALSFARAMGEYGATSMLAGNIAGKTATISQKIAMVVQDGDYAGAGFWVVVIAAIGFFMLLLLNGIGRSKTKHEIS